MRSTLHPFGILWESWDFLCKQPALFHVIAWLIILPSVGQSVIDYVWPVSAIPSIEQIGEVGYAIAMIVWMLMLYWGHAAVFLVARRLVNSKAGRSRTSFSAVRKQSSIIVFPLIITDILQTIIALEWLLIPLAVCILIVVFLPDCLEVLNVAGPYPSTELLAPCAPALAASPLLILPLLYLLRTVFGGVIVATEGLKARDALRESARVMKGSVLRVTGSLVVIVAVLFGPLFVLSFAGEYAQFDPLTREIFTAVLAGISGIPGAVFTITLVVIYTRLKSKGHRQIIPD